MAPNMELIAKTCFPAAKRVIDLFHAQQLTFEAVQDMRIKARWEAIEKETIEVHWAKIRGDKYLAPVFENGDSLKQLLARSRYLLFKKESLWTCSQKQRADSYSRSTLISGKHTIYLCNLDLLRFHREGYIKQNEDFFAKGPIFTGFNRY